MAAAHEAGDSFTEENSLAYLIGCWHLGSMPVEDALPRVEEILRRPGVSRNLRRRTLHGRARFTAMLGRFDEARIDLAEAEELERGLGVSRTSHTGEVELLARDYAAAEAHLRIMYDELLAANDLGHLATASHLLADAVLGQGRLDDAIALTAGVDGLTVPEDIDARSGWRRVRAKALARLGQTDEATQLARESVAIAEETEYFDVLVQSVTALGEVLLVAESHEAAPVLRKALEMHEQKGNLVEAAWIRQVLGPPAT
jgi:tetratricopeptide (TPR) repeat protein